ncbi:MAG: hypothetical protein FJZ58_07025 [Chlamydiae bacterium]|nr:hypothetical protein [Chlamydiota bacterium]
MFLAGASRQYQEIERHIHEDLEAQFSPIRNDLWRRREAGLAKFGFASKEVRQTEEQSGLNALVQQLEEKKEFTDTKMICSEFASKTTVAALMMFNRWLVTELQKHGISIDHALKIPIGEKRRFETIHPGEIIALFSKEGALEKVDPSPTLSRMMSE